MKNKFVLKKFINPQKKVVDQEFEIQEMDLGLFYDLETEYKRGNFSLGQFADSVFKDCMVSPVEAREAEKYFKNHPAAKDMVLGAIRGFLGEGVSRKPAIEFLSEKEQKEELNGDTSKEKTDGK